jgi:uncharacterized membrane protein YqjE
MEKITDSILKFLKLDSLVSNLTGYVEARIALMKSEIKEDVAKAISRGMVMAGLFFMGFLFLVFFSIGLAQFINVFFAYSYAGYWIVAGIYAVIFLFLLVFREKIYQSFESQFSEIMKRKEK